MEVKEGSLTTIAFLTMGSMSRQTTLPERERGRGEGEWVREAEWEGGKRRERERVGEPGLNGGPQLGWRDNEPRGAAQTVTEGPAVRNNTPANTPSSNKP